MGPLGLDPRSQLGVLRSIAVPLDFAIVGKLAQMVFPSGAEAAPFET
jgi:hypothetical protein